VKPIPRHPGAPTKAEAEGHGMDLFRLCVQRTTEWRAQVAAWLADVPESVPVIWTYGPGKVKALTRNIGKCPWRVTVFCHGAGGRDYMPWSHECYRTRLEALLEEARGAEAVLEHFPGRVLTEKEIQNSCCKNQTTRL